MPSDVKGSYRQEQAEATKSRIAAAARRLFAASGYGVTSIESIAAEAGVAVRTVYSAFGSKREILSRICEDWLVQAQARECAERVLADPDPWSRLRGAAEWLTRLYVTGLDVATIFDAATDESPQTRELLRAKLAGRDQVLDAMVASLAPILPDKVARAQATLRALASPGVYRALVIDAGWTPDDFTNWVADGLARTSMGTEGPRGAGRLPE